MPSIEPLRRSATAVAALPDFHIETFDYERNAAAKAASSAVLVVVPVCGTLSGKAGSRMRVEFVGGVGGDDAVWEVQVFLQRRAVGTSDMTSAQGTPGAAAGSELVPLGTLTLTASTPIGENEGVFLAGENVCVLTDWVPHAALSSLETLLGEGQSGLEDDQALWLGCLGRGHDVVFDFKNDAEDGVSMRVVSAVFGE